MKLQLQLFLVALVITGGFELAWEAAEAAGANWQVRTPGVARTVESSPVEHFKCLKCLRN